MREREGSEREREGEREVGEGPRHLPGGLALPKRHPRVPYVRQTRLHQGANTVIIAPMSEGDGAAKRQSGR